MVANEGNPFQHSSKPQAVRSKYPQKGRKENDNSQFRDNYADSHNNKNNNSNEPALNIMCDPRVIRGSTFSKNSIYTKVKISKENEAHLPGSSLSKEKSMKEQLLRSRRKAKKTSIFDMAMPNFIQTEIGLDKILIEKKILIPTIETFSQTDRFNKYQGEPDFIPMKTGIDNFTQISKADNPFVFDIHVIPLLETIVAKTIEQALDEVQEETELLALKEEIKRLHQVKQEEQNEANNLEQAKGKEWVVKEQKRKKERDRVASENAVCKKIGSATLMRNLLPQIVSGIYNDNFQTGTWPNFMETRVRSNFLPWLFGSVSSKIRESTVSRQVMENLVKDSFKKNEKLIVAEKERIKVFLQEEERARKLEEMKASVSCILPEKYFNNKALVLKIALESTLTQLDGLVKEWIRKFTEFFETESFSFSYSFEDKEKNVVNIISGQTLSEHGIEKRGTVITIEITGAQE